MMQDSLFKSILVCAGLLSAWSASLWADEPPAIKSLPRLMGDMTTRGIEVVPSVTDVLPPPLIASSDSVKDRTQKLEKLSSRHGWQRFSRASVAAPVHIELAYINDSSGQRVGHRIYSAFVAYCPIEKIKDQKLLESLLASGKDDDAEPIGLQSEPLSAEILSSVGIDKPNDELTRFATLVLPLMNRVTLRGTARIEKFESDTSLLVVWQLDPRFSFASANLPNDSLKPYANHYVKTDHDDLGRDVESEPKPYSGCGGYLSVQKTGLQEDQLLIESRMILHEPDDWFAGSNFLRSKLPTALQENAQSFRRKVAR